MKKSGLKVNSWFEYGWTLDTDTRNFGDLLLRESASKLFNFKKLAGSTFVSGFFGGSVLNPYFVDLVNSKIEAHNSFFWGCGISDQNSLPILNSRNKIFGLRGRVSEALVDHSVAIGDPGLLASLALGVWPKKKGNQIVFISHYHDKFVFKDDRVKNVSVIVPPYISSKHLVSEIASSKFVFTGSLHVAICAYALGVPFGLYANGYIDNEVKFHDFASMTKLQISFFDSLDKAITHYFDSGNFKCGPTNSDAKKLLEVVRPYLNLKGKMMIWLWPFFLRMRSTYSEKRNHELLEDLREFKL